MEYYLSQNGVQVTHKEPLDGPVGEHGESPEHGGAITDVSQTGQVANVAEIHVRKPARHTDERVKTCAPHRSACENLHITHVKT